MYRIYVQYRLLQDGQAVAELLCEEADWLENERIFPWDGASDRLSLGPCSSWEELEEHIERALASARAVIERRRAVWDERIPERSVEL